MLRYAPILHGDVRDLSSAHLGSYFLFIFSLRVLVLFFCLFCRGCLTEVCALTIDFILLIQDNRKTLLHAWYRSQFEQFALCILCTGVAMAMPASDLQNMAETRIRIAEHTGIVFFCQGQEGFPPRTPKHPFIVMCPRHLHPSDLPADVPRHGTQFRLHRIRL